MYSWECTRSNESAPGPQLARQVARLARFHSVFTLLCLPCKIQNHQIWPVWSTNLAHDPPVECSYTPCTRPNRSTPAMAPNTRSQPNPRSRCQHKPSTVRCHLTGTQLCSPRPHPSSPTLHLHPEDTYSVPASIPAARSSSVGVFPKISPHRGANIGTERCCRTKLD